MALPLSRHRSECHDSAEFGECFVFLGIKHRHAFKSHILTKKTAKRKRHLRHADMLQKGDRMRVRRMLGMGG